MENNTAETIMDPALLGILEMAYQQVGIQKMAVELDAELADLVQGALRMTIDEAIKTEPRRILEITLKRALRIVKPETNEPEATMDSVALTLLTHARNCDKNTQTMLEDQANTLVGKAAEVRLWKMSY